MESVHSAIIYQTQRGVLAILYEVQRRGGGSTLVVGLIFKHTNEQNAYQEVSIFYSLSRSAIACLLFYVPIE